MHIPRYIFKMQAATSVYVGGLNLFSIHTIGKIIIAINIAAAKKDSPIIIQNVKYSFMFVLG